MIIPRHSNPALRRVLSKARHSLSHRAVCPLWLLLALAAASNARPASGQQAPQYELGQTLFWEDFESATGLPEPFSLPVSGTDSLSQQPYTRPASIAVTDRRTFKGSYSLQIQGPGGLCGVALVPSRRIAIHRRHGHWLEASAAVVGPPGSQACLQVTWWTATGELLEVQQSAWTTRSDGVFESLELILEEVPFHLKAGPRSARYADFARLRLLLRSPSPATAWFDNIHLRSSIFIESFEMDTVYQRDQIDTPDRWIRVPEDEAPSFPGYNRVERVSARARSGSYCLYLWTQKADVGAQLKARRYVPVRTDRNYHLSGWVSTSNMGANKVQFAMTWFTEEGIPLGIMVSDPLRGDHTDFLPIKMTMEQVPEKASFMGLQVLLTGSQIHAECWVDDLIVTEQMQARVFTEAVGNMHDPDEHEAVRIHVRVVGQLDATPMKAQLTVTDLAGQRLNETWAADYPKGWNEARYESGEGDWIEVVFELKPLPEPGYYDIWITSTDEEQVVARNASSFIVQNYTKPPSKFQCPCGIVLHPYQPAIEDLPPLLDRLGAGWAKCYLWDAAGPLETEWLESGAVRELLTSLRRAEIRSIGVLASPPASQLRDKSFRRMADTFASPETGLQSTLREWKERLWGELEHWQIGGDWDTSFQSHLEQANLTAILQQIDASFLQSKRRVEFSIPWPLIDPLSPSSPVPPPPTGPGASTPFSIWVPSDLTPGVLSRWLQKALPPAEARTAWDASVELKPGSRIDRARLTPEQTRQLIAQTLLLLAAGSRTVLLEPLQLYADEGLLDAKGIPTPAFLAVQNLNSQLRARYFLPNSDQLAVDPRIATFAFASATNTEGVFVAWLRRDPAAPPGAPAEADLTLTIGERPRLVDALGFTATTRRSPRGVPLLRTHHSLDPPTWTLRVTQDPIFVTDIDPRLLALQLQVNLLPDTVLKLNTAWQPKLLALRNPFTGAISGLSARLHNVPQGWKPKLDNVPRAIEFGKEGTADLSLRLPHDFTIVEGKLNRDNLQLVLAFDVAEARGSRHYEVLVQKPVTYKPEVDVMVVEGFPKRHSGRFSVILQVTNQSGRLVTLQGQCHFMAPKEAVAFRQENFWVNHLRPGLTARVPLAIEDPDRSVTYLIVELVEKYGDAFLNKRFMTPP